MGKFSDDIGRLGRQAWDSVGDYYQRVVLGIPFPQREYASEPHDPLARLKELRAERDGNTRERALGADPDRGGPDRGGPDFDR